MILEATEPQFCLIIILSQLAERPLFCCIIGSPFCGTTNRYSKRLPDC